MDSPDDFVQVDDEVIDGEWTAAVVVLLCRDDEFTFIEGFVMAIYIIQDIYFYLLGG